MAKTKKTEPEQSAEESTRGIEKKKPEPEFVFLVRTIGQEPATVPMERFKKLSDIYRKYIRVYPEE